jgi:hypothetical protein
VFEDTVLVAAPDSDEVVGTAQKDTHVEGLTGEVHTVPVPVAVVHPEPAYQPNAVKRASLRADMDLAADVTHLTRPRYSHGHDTLYCSHRAS